MLDRRQHQNHHGIFEQLKDRSLFIEQAYINDEWVEKQKTFDVIEPSTASVLGRVADCTVEDFRAAIESAYVAQQEYADSTTGAQPGAFLRKWCDLILQNVDDLATILALENGKTLAEAKGEIVYAASFVSWFAEEATRSYGHTIPSSTANATLYTTREPVGVCGIITPWNSPAAMITRKVAPALAAGCAVVIKPPSETPYTALALARLAGDAGVHHGVLHVCPTKDRTAATELAIHPLVSKLSFTGSTSVGKMLAKLSAQTLKKVSLELGGNAPFIVFEDADIDLAVEGVMFCKFWCTGQTCVCANRILVQKNIAAAFTSKLTAAVAKLKYGHNLDPETTQGPLVNEAAIAKVAAHVEDAVAKGAKVEIGGTRVSGPGFFFVPTVISGAKRNMLVAEEETFGPLAPIFEFDSEADALRLANDTEFGLAGYFFSRDISRYMRVARKLQVGMVGVNTGKISAAEAPFGGVKESGYGKEGSLYGLEEYQVIKSVTIGNQDK
ncbi:succinate semialdehyde dehydrogenase NADP+ linked [Vermiconidia calcicola]|uniref:Succinate semialdehyde dehydrogenase NADP+ linked n=1 Tax=Vermiconidia calcicola TaxID=1690605 RepID=A0ACC3MUG9_9PEZI|nr:succinate semialdehyde dehydrogenase NADP+ linked [Vermiconidia calcicola]